MRHWLARRLNASLDRRLPERRLYIRSDRGTRFVRLSAGSQIALAAFGVVALGWVVLGTAVIVSGLVGPQDAAGNPIREQRAFESRLEALATARDAHALEATAAQERYAAALSRISAMQESLLRAEGRLLEADTGLEVVHRTMGRVIAERDAARRELAALTGEADVESATAALNAAGATVDVLAAALGSTAAERDALVGAAAEREAEIDRLALEARLTRERQERILAQLEEAVSGSLEPLEEMFGAAGLPSEAVLATVRAERGGQGGPLEPIAALPGPGAADALRANAILEALGQLTLYRAAVDTLPFADPVPSGAYRLSSGFGPRHDPFGRGTRMHSGTDFAGARGTPIHATADGVVTRAGWMRGYGKTIDIAHAHGHMTRYAHLNSIGVKRGQRVSRGDRIGGMGTTGRSTGVHLHYEVHADGKPIDPMTYIKAARDVL